MKPLEAQYARLLRWYPRAWRDRNGAAMVGALLDQADETGRMTPSPADRASLIAGGLRQRTLEPMVLPLAAAVAFLVWYLAVIAGTFAHPSLVTLGLLTITLVATIEWLQLARVLAVVAACSAIALAFSLEGPGPSVTVVLAGLALVAATRTSRRSHTLMLIAAVVLAVVSAESWRSVAILWPLVVIPQFWIAVLVGLAAAAGAVLLSAATVVRRVAMRGEPAP
jgi:hypothetical protein